MSGISFNLDNRDDEPEVTPPEADDVRCDGWWPAINLTSLRDTVRLQANVSTATIRDSVRQAMLDIATELASWRAEQEAAGYESLAEVPPRISIDDRSDFAMRWLKAVRSVVAADIGERQVTQQLTSAGADRADVLSRDVDVHQRNIRFAVRDFLGRPRIIAEAL